MPNTGSRLTDRFLLNVTALTALSANFQQQGARIVRQP